MIVGVPSNDFGGQEPGTPVDIMKTAHDEYGVTFPLAAKAEVKGTTSAPVLQMGRGRAAARDAALEFPQIPDRPRRPHRRRVPDRRSSRWTRASSTRSSRSSTAWNNFGQSARVDKLSHGRPYAASPIGTPARLKLNQRPMLTLTSCLTGGIHMNVHPKLHVRYRRPGPSGRAAVAARLLHDGVGRRRRRLYARRRSGARRGDQDRHQRPHRRRGQGQGRRTARCRSISRRPANAQNPPVILVCDGDLRPARIHQGRDPPARQARRLRDRARLLFPQGRPHQDHRRSRT